MANGIYDLEDRLIRVGAAVCRLCAKLPQGPVGKVVTLQLVRCATSPFANYGEVQSAESRRDFVHKLSVCLKELRETRVWLKFLVEMRLESDNAAVCSLIEESQQLISILRASVDTARRNGQRNVECRMTSVE